MERYPRDHGVVENVYQTWWETSHHHDVLHGSERIQICDGTGQISPHRRKIILRYRTSTPSRQHLYVLTRHPIHNRLHRLDHSVQSSTYIRSLTESEIIGKRLIRHHQ